MGWSETYDPKTGKRELFGEPEFASRCPDEVNTPLAARRWKQFNGNQRKEDTEASR